MHTKSDIIRRFYHNQNGYNRGLHDGCQYWNRNCLSFRNLVFCVEFYIVCPFSIKACDYRFGILKLFIYSIFVPLNVSCNQYWNRIGGVMVSMLSYIAVDRGFEPRWSQTNDYKYGICCFSAKHTSLRIKNKVWLVRSQNNVSEYRDMSSRGLLFQWASTIKNPTKLIGLV